VTGSRCSNKESKANALDASSALALFFVFAFVLSFIVFFFKAHQLQLSFLFYSSMMHLKPVLYSHTLQQN
jgi:hypothetical protein